MIPIFDTHAHYDDEAFDEDRDELLARLPREGIARVVNIGAGLDTSRKALELAEQYDHVYCTVGVHPSDTGSLNEEDFEQLRNLCASPKCVAVGEIGLDYYWQEPDPAIQKEWFVRQMNLAGELSLPMVVHSRDAAKDTVDLMKAAGAEEIGGVVHCYSYTKETARIFLDMGFFFGIGGVLTFKNARKLKETVEYLPMDRMVLETDCPYLAPVPFRGKRNSSLYIPYVISAIAEIKGITEEEVREHTWKNAHRLYGLQEPGCGKYNKYN